MTDTSTPLIRAGCPDRLIPAAARLYWDAFRRKLGAALAPEEKALAFLAGALDGRFAVAAVAGDRLLGVAGFKVAEGAFVNATMRTVGAVYGWPGALWRTSILTLLDRRAEPDVLVMDGIAVAAEARGQGIGGRLLDAVADEARRRGLGAVRLGVVDTNPRAAALYRRSGFTAVRRTRKGPLRHLLGFSAAEIMVRPVSGEPGA